MCATCEMDGDILIHVPFVLRDNHFDLKCRFQTEVFIVVVVVVVVVVVAFCCFASY